MHPYIPHTAEDRTAMLDTIGADSIAELFTDIPKQVRDNSDISMENGISEFEVSRRFEELANRNHSDLICFAGYGCYDHIIPATVDHIIRRSEFYTAYTPYQAEISQGILQSIFEFQSMMCRLTGLESSNASLYDGFTAFSEAAVVALNSVRKSDTVLYASTIHPFAKEVLKTFFSALPVNLVEVPAKGGTVPFEYLQKSFGEGTAAYLVQSPNVFGYLEDLTGFADFLHQRNALLVQSVNPMSLGMLKSPGEWDADIAIGDTQPFGLGMNFGGPTAGFITAKNKYLRKLPGRIVGRTLDHDGRDAYVLTLQAREQHIRREKATSNICSNQALSALGSTVYMATIGKAGLAEAAKQCHNKAHYLFEKIMKHLPCEAYSDAPFFNEFTLRFEIDSEVVQQKCLEHGIFAGIVDKAENTLTIAVTEKRTKQELDKFVEVLTNTVAGVKK